jgi:uncharacterized membrane protein
MSRLLAKKWAIALVVSLALNLFLGGMMTARWMMRPPGSPHRGMGMKVRSLKSSLGRHLDPSVHETLERVDAKHRETVRGRMKEAAEASRLAQEALADEDFDEAKAKQAFADARAKQAAAREAMQNALIELAAALPPAERAKLRKAWGRRKGPRGEGRRKGPRGEGRHRGPPRDSRP